LTLGLERFFNFGIVERDAWIAKQAMLVAPASRVLDVGAGPARYRELFAHCDYRTQDFCQHFGSAEGGLAEGDKWQYGQIDYVSDAESIPVADGEFDVVVCTEVLEHVPRPENVVRELGRVLRPGGILIASAPLGSGLHQEPHHFVGGFTPYWYNRFLSEAGFANVVVLPNGGFFKHYGQESQRFSALLDPRRLPTIPAAIIFPFWLLTLPWFRIFLPIACHYLDALDKYRGFTVGYHVTATRS
jgi:SAM-dependent methyltransferase